MWKRGDIVREAPTQMLPDASRDAGEASSCNTTCNGELYENKGPGIHHNGEDNPA